MADMLHYDEIARALRLVCQGAAALTEDTNATDTVTVSSSCLFSAGDAVVLSDASEQQETHTVSEILGLTQIKLDAAVSGEYTVVAQARLQLAQSQRPAVKWISVGHPEALPAPARLEFPAVVIEPGIMKQPPNAGSNRSYQQEYTFQVYYLDRYEEGVEADMDAIEEAAGLFNLIMSDPYLGGTCYHSQVVEFEPSPQAEQKLRSKELPLRVVRIQVLARRAEVWT